MNYTDINSKTIDRWVKEGWEWGQPISHEEYMEAKKGNWKVLLTPTKPVPKSYFPTSLEGLRILGLACGGAQQMPIFSALGAKCTVLDYSSLQLESEEMVSKREGYNIEIVKHDMTKPLPFTDASFDLIFAPVSNCYIEEMLPLFKECYRVLKNDGILLGGYDNGINFITFDENSIENKLPFNPLKDKVLYKKLEEEDDGIQFSHSYEEIIGGLLKCGFTITDFYEDTNGYGRLHELNIPTFCVIRAIKKS